MYAMSGTPADLGYAFSRLSRYSSNPQGVHCKALKHVMRYVKATLGLGLTLGLTTGGLQVFTDSDWAGDKDSQRSSGGYVPHLGGGPTSWESKLQPMVALSLCEAEYMAVKEATKKAIWLQDLLNDLDPSTVTDRPTTIHSDNQGTIALARNPVHHIRTKHIDIQYHYVREQTEAGFS